MMVVAVPTGPAAPAHVACWSQILPKCVHAYEIHKKTHGTLLVLRMCIKLVIYSSRTRGFYGQNFVVRTVNTFVCEVCLYAATILGHVCAGN
jgi:hypothetical protein